MICSKYSKLKSGKNMIDEKDILPFGRFKYPQPYTGSCNGMRFKITHPKPAEGEENVIIVEVWDGELCYEKANQDAITKITFPYSKEGYDEIIPYLNEKYSSEFAIKR